MPLPPLYTLTEDADQNDVAARLYLGHLRDALENFTPSQVAAALDLGGLGAHPGGPFDGITVPVSPPTPATPTGLTASGFYRQIALAWDLDPNPFITGWEVQRATDLAFTLNVTTLTSARALAFVDNDRADSTTYYYRIRALTQDPANFSSFTAVVSATTLANDTGVLAALAAASVLLQRAHILNLVVDTAKITDASISEAKIANLSVSTAKIQLLAVTEALIANLAVTNAKIASLAVTNAKINDVAADKLTAGTITVLVTLTNNTIKLDGINSVITVTDTQGSPVIRAKMGKLGAGASDYGFQAYNDAGNLMWDSTNQGATNLGIKDLAVISAKLNDLAVLTGKIANNAVTAVASTNVSSAGYTNSTTSYTDVGVTVTVTTTGAPVQLSMTGNFLMANTSGAIQKCTMAYKIVRDSTSLPEFGRATALGASGAAGGADSEIFGAPYTYLDPAPTAASHTYKLQAKCVTANTTITGDVFNLGLLEIKK